jgi:tetratricopeptide (TPR) repeat protein
MPGKHCFGTSWEQLQQTKCQIADSAYQMENYAEAIRIYEEIAKEYEEANLFYNLGNAYYKNGENAKALLWYERALKLDPSDEDIQHNIAFVNRKIIDKIDAVPETLFAQWWHKVTDLLTERQWAVLSIIGSFLLFLSIGAYLFARSGGVRTTGFVTFWISIIVIVFSVIFANKQKEKATHHTEAIVMDLVVDAKNAPNAGGKNLFVIHEGLKVQITNEMNGWVEIRLPNGEKGWIAQNSIEKI